MHKEQKGKQWSTCSSTPFNIDWIASFVGRRLRWLQVYQHKNFYINNHKWFDDLEQKKHCYRPYECQQETLFALLLAAPYIFKTKHSNLCETVSGQGLFYLLTACFVISEDLFCTKYCLWWKDSSLTFIAGMNRTMQKETLPHWPMLLISCLWIPSDMIYWTVHQVKAKMSASHLINYYFIAGRPFVSVDSNFRTGSLLWYTLYKCHLNTNLRDLICDFTQAVSISTEID